MLTKTEQHSLRLIESPKQKPQFPITATYPINVPGFSNVLLKDESTNPTGTHKDRMAWEIVWTCRNMLRTKKRTGYPKQLPTFSILSAGSAALALQHQFKKYGLAPIKVLTDYEHDKTNLKQLKQLGCQIYQTNLEKKELSGTDILRLTHNKNGLDITSNHALDPNQRFYDWLAYEAINHNPDYCFVPYGTGNLYQNILNINKKEIIQKKHPVEFSGNPKHLQNCHFLGATTNNPKTSATKLYAPFLPFSTYSTQYLKTYMMSGFCGNQSKVSNITEKSINQALDIAQDNQITCEPSGIAGLALLLQIKKQVPKNKKILIINTGKTKMPESTNQ